MRRVSFRYLIRAQKSREQFNEVLSVAEEVLSRFE